MREFFLGCRGATFFSEEFNAGQTSNLTGYDSFTLGGGVIRRNGSYSNSNDRRYMRTVASDYNTVDFRYELTYTTSFLSQTSINFIGIGSGDRRPGGTFGHNEPWESLFFRIHTPNVDGGAVGIGNHPATNIAGIGSIPTAGVHRARIEKSGSAITFSIDAHYDGDFVADLSHTFPDLSLVAPFLNTTNSRLFFGTVFPDDSFDDMNVVPEPSTLALATLGFIVLCAWGWRRPGT